jgi:outer membrane immunogenic protein
MQTSSGSTATAIGIGTTSLLAAAVGGAAPAEAQATGPGNWTGMYLGFTGGFAALSTQMNDTAVASGLGYAAWGTSQGTNAKLGAKGAMAGLHAGYNLQAGKIVYGVEADISWANVKASGTGRVNNASNYGYSYGGGTSNFSSKVDALATVKARLGYDLNGSTMVFVTGGFATANVKNSWSSDALSSSFGPTVAASSSSSGWKSGYVLGGGFDQKISGNLLLKAEIDWVKLGSRNLGAPYPQSGYGGAGTPGGIGFGKTELVIGRLGLSYKF